MLNLLDALAQLDRLLPFVGTQRLGLVDGHITVLRTSGLEPSVEAAGIAAGLTHVRSRRDNRALARRSVDETPLDEAPSGLTSRTLFGLKNVREIGATPSSCIPRHPYSPTLEKAPGDDPPALWKRDADNRTDATVAAKHRVSDQYRTAAWHQRQFL